MGKTSIYYLMAVVITMSFLSCKNNSSSHNDNKNQTVIVDETRNSTDYEGVYTGTMPCADCSGIYTEITLKGNEYTMKTVYEGKEGDNTFESKGNYTWNNDKTVITLGNDRGERYKVKKGRLIALDMDGNVITGDLADSYILHKK